MYLVIEFLFQQQLLISEQQLRHQLRHHARQHSLPLRGLSRRLTPRLRRQNANRANQLQQQQQQHKQQQRQQQLQQSVNGPLVTAVESGAHVRGERALLQLHSAASARLRLCACARKELCASVQWRRLRGAEESPRELTGARSYATAYCHLSGETPTLFVR